MDCCNTYVTVMPEYLHMDRTKHLGPYLEPIYSSGCRNQFEDLNSSPGIVNFNTLE